MSLDLTSELSSSGYWPALAREYLEKGQYARTIELCTFHLDEEPGILSGRLILAQALYYSGQIDGAEEQFYRVLHIDPNNLVALKFLGDLKYKQGDEYLASSFYTSVMRLDPDTRGLKSDIFRKVDTETKILTLCRGREKDETEPMHLRQLPFVTETAGDLLLSQGHNRMAARIFGELAKKTQDPRIIEKLKKTRALRQNSKG